MSSVQRWKTIAIKLPTIVSEQTARIRSPGCCKQEQKNFESYGDLADQAFSQFHENSIKNQDPHNQIENDETPCAKYLNENDSENMETNKTSAIHNFMSHIL